MAGNRFNRLPVSSATQTVQLKNDVNVLSAAIEQEFLKVDKVMSEEDMLESNSQLTWFFL